MHFCGSTHTKYFYIEITYLATSERKILYVDTLDMPSIVKANAYIFLLHVPYILLCYEILLLATKTVTRTNQQRYFLSMC